MARVVTELKAGFENIPVNDFSYISVWQLSPCNSFPTKNVWQQGRMYTSEVVACSSCLWPWASYSSADGTEINMLFTRGVTIEEEEEKEKEKKKDVLWNLFFLTKQSASAGHGQEV